MTTSPQALQTAAAVLCLLDDTPIPLQKSLEHLGPPQALNDLQLRLKTADRQCRARTMAVILHRLGMDLDAWRIV